ncbi:hypothetical protein BDZ94DRAFT_1230533 [Collybia nuda]|uniref:RNase H type-1 domain-containing protein n=1 Tax=Collybia nuda TaxID=64659 RepID=A0A9P5XU90_9AGAR|nr:hypothetical protein BDZ94DRAFT_1230533 [Collybia nuda]
MPGHAGVEGNEIVDEEAKKAAQGDSTPLPKSLITLEDPPGSLVLKIYKDLPRHVCSIVAQLRTGHIVLNAYLSRMKLIDSPLCPHCHVLEMVDHFLLHCRWFNTQRHILHLSLGKAPFTCRSLLGRRAHTKNLLQYVHDTQVPTL